MKRGILKLSAAAILWFAFAAPAHAQSPEWNNFLRHYPDLDAKLHADPCLIIKPEWRHGHPNLEKFLQAHPGESNRLRAEAHRRCGGGHGGPVYGGPAYGGQGWGDYDEHHEWHDYNWWQAHNPAWARQHHPEWWAPHGPFAPHPGHPGEAMRPEERHVVHHDVKEHVKEYKEHHDKDGQH